MSTGRGRPGGNPDLEKHRFSNGGQPVRTKVLSIRLTEEQMSQLREKHGDRLVDYCRELILNNAS